jgi:hypothetical protein
MKAEFKAKQTRALRKKQRSRLDWCSELAAIALEDARPADRTYTDDEILSIGVRLFNLLAVTVCEEERRKSGRSHGGRTRLERKLAEHLEDFVREQRWRKAAA